MRVLFYLASAFTLSLALPQGSQELVATDDCPEVVPGPGLPSLASLNLTSADLCKSPEEFQMSLYGQVESPSSAQDSANDEKQLVKRYTPWCSGTHISAPYAASCFNYLYALGSTACEVPRGVVSRFCHSTGSGSNVAWYGSTIDGLYSSSTCMDVARGGEWVFWNCIASAPGAGPQFIREGANAAWGNARLAVRIGPM
ncbi:hypothetical protein CC2G_013520 [Coprinopsis cinerea AmutBmut pab1-1]|nr:hypothetical protein CC2G_013520 [Coprinopsis cinerea AmutBmut pab1-1]